MASGDAVIKSGSISAGARTTYTVPSGEVWVITGAAQDGGNAPRLGVDDGTTEMVDGYEGGRNEPKGKRLVLTDSDQPMHDNYNCTSRPWYYSGREL